VRRLFLATLLLGIFLISLCVNGLILSHYRDSMSTKVWWNLAEDFLRVHSVPIAVLLGGMFTHGRKRDSVPGVLSAVAVVLSIFWAVCIAMVWNGYGTRQDVNATGEHSVDEYLLELSGNVSFLIAGMLAYVSASKTKGTNLGASKD
jgi:hypothetical protein